ncbi:Tol-Pal system protein TolB [subsurface metagenome]
MNNLSSNFEKEYFLLKVMNFFILYTVLVLFSIPLQGGIEWALTFDHYNHEYPQFSPIFANWIAYQKRDESGFWQIYKVTWGEPEIALTTEYYEHCYPQWSPDTYWIAYQRDDATGYLQIYKIPSSGGVEIVLTSDSFPHYKPQWSPNGSEIAYHKFDSTSYSQIYKIPSDGGIENSTIHCISTIFHSPSRRNRMGAHF